MTWPPKTASHGRPILLVSTSFSLTPIYPSSLETCYCFKYLRHEASSCCPLTCIYENTGSLWNLSNMAEEATVGSEEKVTHIPLSVDQSPQFSADTWFSLWFDLLQIPSDTPALRKPTSQDFLPIILNQLKLSSSIWKWQHGVKKVLTETQSMKHLNRPQFLYL